MKIIKQKTILNNTILRGVFELWMYLLKHVYFYLK